MLILLTGGFMEYVVEMASGGHIYANFIKIGSEAVKESIYSKLIS
jgi:hypothetical protein